MRRFLPFALMALAVPTCAFAQSAPVGTSATAASTAAVTPAKAKPKSAFGAVIAELTRAAQDQAAAAHKPTAATSNASAPALPAPPHAAAKATLADSSGG